MRIEAEIAETAALFGDPVRAAMLAALLDSPALSAGQLAFAAKVSPQAASFHLAKLVSASILKVERFGRTKVYQLAGSEVATAIESLAAISPPRPPSVSSAWFRSERKQQLRLARTCYDHLAGVIGVAFHDQLLDLGYMNKSGERTYEMTDKGRHWLKTIGLDPHAGTRSVFARTCLDWSERQPHLAGRLAAQLLDFFLKEKWIERIRDTRAVRVTDRGFLEFQRRYGLDLRMSIHNSGLESQRRAG
ncbi:MAG TPA: winged helix-turn-helix domain-containing protein [Blastocatellia bacterium]|nr:winged helix-turn-helix domain-containing protein [Blastocatellia bacterium]